MRRFLALVFLLLFTSFTYSQTTRATLISAAQNISAPDAVSHSHDVTPDCATPWSVALKTLHGGKQEGVRLITLDNGKMQIVLIPTRGMGILSVTLTPDPSPKGRGEPLKLGWKSPVTEVVHPRHVNLNLRGGLGWLEGFNEWLCRCGLENTGQAGKDEIINNVGDKQTVDLTLHGKIANIPASEVEVLVEKAPPHRITVRGVVHEKMLFGPKLELITEVSTEPGSDTFRIRDTVTNKGSQPQEYQILYHYNFGKPLLGDGAKLHVPVERVTPYNANAAKAVKSWNTFAGPVPGYVEQVYLLRPLEDKNGRVNVLLHNPQGERGVVLQYAKKELPYLTLWKNTGHDDDGYVIGIEPGVSYPNMRKVERAAGRLPTLAGGASHTMTMDFRLIDKKASLDEVVVQLGNIQKSKAPVIDAQPQSAKEAKMDKTKAGEKAVAYAYQHWGDLRGHVELVVFDKYTVETKQGWLVTLSTRAYIETGDINKSLPIGFGLILIRHDNGEGYQFSTGYGRDDIIRKLNAGERPWER